MPPSPHINKISWKHPCISILSWGLLCSLKVAVWTGLEPFDARGAWLFARFARNSPLGGGDPRGLGSGHRGPRSRCDRLRRLRGRIRVVERTPVVGARRVPRASLDILRRPSKFKPLATSECENKKPLIFRLGVFDFHNLAFPRGFEPLYPP